MKYTATYLVIGEGPKTFVFSTEKINEKEIREEAWHKVAYSEGMNPEKIQLLDCKPSLIDDDLD